jgi:hypothetical protein
VLLADELHFALAAGRTFLSQLAFSRSIAALEETAGLRLFDRGRGYLRLTGTGESPAVHGGWHADGHRQRGRRRPRQAAQRRPALGCVGAAGAGGFGS